MDNKIKITKEIYDLFCQHGSELLWIADPIRQARPRGTNEQTDDDFIVLESLDECLELIYNDYCSEKLKKQQMIKIEELKSKVTDEVFQLIIMKYQKQS